MKKLRILFLLLVASVSQAQVSQQGSLRDEIILRHRLSASGRIDQNVLTMPSVNNEAQLQRARQIAAQCATCKRDFYGTGIDIAIDIKKQTPALLEQGKLWTMTIESPGAFALQFYFEHYKVPQGGELYFRNEEGTMMLGAFGSLNNHEDGKFATQTIQGDRITIYYFEPHGASFSGALKINKVIHAFKSVYKVGEFRSSQACEIDINCPSGSNYQDVKRAVARISFYDASFNLSAHCSGSLLNTTSSSQKPYLLTANHCVTAPPGLENTAKYRYWQWIFEFNYETPLCNGTVEPLAQSVQGATLLSKGALSDYALLNISTVPANYNVMYLGWDTRDNVVPTKGVAIHHPNGDVKKISIDEQSPVMVKTETTGNLFGEVAGLPKTDFRVTWNTGITEGGSSGSPLINQEKRVVGQLRGGDSDCATPTNPDYFGRLALSMDYPDPTYSFATLRSLIDDNNTGATNWASLDPSAPNNETFKVNSIEATSNRWEDDPKLFGRITYNGNVQNLTYSWSPAADFLDPHAAVGILYFGGQKPALPLTKQYSLTVTTPGGLIGNQVLTITLYDCQNKEIYLDLCSESDSEIGFIGSNQEIYSWSPATHLSSTTIANPVFSPPGTGEFTYTLSVTSANCSRIENYHLSVMGFPELPAFTPSRVSERALALTNGSSTIKMIKASDGGFFVLKPERTLTKLDANLDVIWSTAMAPTLPIAPRDLVEVNGNIVVLFHSNTLGLMHLYTVNSSGTVVLQKTYSPPTSQESYDGEQIYGMGNGDVVVTGQYLNSSTTRNVGFMFRFNAAGSYVYAKIMNYMINFDYVKYRVMSSTMSSNGEVYFITDKYLIKVYASNGANGSIKPHTFSDWDAGNQYYVNNIQKIVLAHDGNMIGIGGKLNPATNTYDIRMIKFDLNANLIWSRYFATTPSDESDSRTLLRTSDGGYLVGTSSSGNAGGDKSQPAWNSSNDYWIVKTDNSGNITGDVRYGGTSNETLEGITDVGLGNYLIYGSSASSPSGDRTVAKTHPTLRDIWMLQILDSESPSTNPTPQVLEVCESADATFNNSAEPYRNELVIIGDCAAPVTFADGSVTSVRGSEAIIIKPDTHIKMGATFTARIGSVNLSPCDIALIEPSSLADGAALLMDDVVLIESDVNAETLSKSVSLYPNPSNGEVTIRIQLPEKTNVRMTIVNVLGIVVLTREYKDSYFIEDSIQFENSGVYSVLVQFSDHAHHEKVIVTR